MNGLRAVKRSAKERLRMLYTGMRAQGVSTYIMVASWYKIRHRYVDNKRVKLKIVLPTAAMAKLAIDSASLELSLYSCNKEGDFHSTSGGREIFIITQKIGRSPAKSGGLEAL